MSNCKYELWLKPDRLAALRGWVRDGLADSEIARNIGVRRETLLDWKKRFPEIADALNPEFCDFQVEDALLQKALSGNTTAQMFWLKNRRPRKWCGKEEPGGDIASELRVVADANREAARRVLDSAASADDCDTEAEV